MFDRPEIHLPNVSRHARIGILGGSFDPPHLCHQLLAMSFLSLESVDELWIIPCANHASKDVQTLFHHRFAMCKIAFRRLADVRVLDIESKLKAPSYTIETINAIIDKRPDLMLTLCLGSDLIASFNTWLKASEIAQKVHIVIFERTAYPIGVLPISLKNAHLHCGYALPEIASTSLRDSFNSKDKLNTDSLVDREVLQYIKDNHLYAF